MLAEIAFAQTGGAAGDAPAFLQFGPLVIILGLAYFLLIRPQRQQEREHRAMLANLKRNDEVTTSGGLLGRVVSLTDAVVIIEVAPKVQVRVERAQVKSLLKPQGGDEKDAKRDKEKDKEKGKAQG
jgi:preprotein translocase subunit YajC